MNESEENSLDYVLLLNEIESGSSGCIANVIRQLREYEFDAYRAGHSGPFGELVASFISALDIRVVERNAEIEKMCAHHYQGFVEATKDLDVQSDATSLQKEINTFDGSLTHTIQKYFASCKSLSDCKSTVEHIDQCIQAVQLTLPILDQYLRVEQSISEGRYYHALRTLDDLEHSHLANVRAFAFSELLTRRIPKLRSDIKQASLTELTDFLATIRKHSAYLGKIAMRETAATQGMDVEALLTLSTNGDEKVSRSSNSKSSREKPADDPMLSGDVSDLSAATLDKELEELGNLYLDKQTNDSDPSIHFPISPNANPTHLHTESLVDFGPVYRCLHIHTALKEQAEFERHYCTQRRKQCQLSLSLSSSKQANMRNYDDFFSSVCGFFVVDDYLRHTLPGSSTSYQTYLDELWNNATERLVEFAKANTSNCHSITDIIRFKDYTALFTQTMASLGFSIAGLSEMIAYIQRRYHFLLTKQWTEKLQKIVHDDRLVPYEVRTEAEMSQLVELYPPCATPEFVALPFPRHLVCSMMVPRIYKTAHEYMNLCYSFCVNLNLSFSELEDTITRATNGLFTDCLKPMLSQAASNYSRSLSNLLQFYINLSELETVCDHLDVYLRKLVPLTAFQADLESTTYLQSSGKPPRRHLNGPSLIKDIRSHLEIIIYAYLEGCVDSFFKQLNDCEVDGSVVNGSQSNLRNLTTTSEPIKKLTTWINNTFKQLSTSAPAITSTACANVCKRISRLMSDILFNANFDLTNQRINQLSMDLSACEQLVRSQSVPGLGRDTLPKIFADLRQLLDLLLRDDWNLFVSSFRKQTGNPYDLVSPSVALRLLKKMYENDKKRTGFLSGMRKEERDRRKRLEDVMNQIRLMEGAQK